MADKFRFSGPWSLSGAILTGGVGMAVATLGGAYLDFEFDGTGAAVTFDMAANAVTQVTSPYCVVAWRVDGVWTSSGVIAASVTVATGLTSGRHTVRLLVKGIGAADNYTPLLANAVPFTGVTVTGGSLADVTAVSRWTWEVFGDSIAAGYNMNPGAATPALKMDSLNNWPYLISEAFDIDLHARGRSGWAYATVPDVFNLMYSGAAYTPTVQPNLVALELGTNDDVAIDEATVYTRLATVRTARPSALIAVLAPFVLGNPGRLRNCVAALRKAGDRRIVFVETAGFMTSTSDGVHPDTAGAAAIAARLGPIINSFRADVAADPPVLSTNGHYRISRVATR